MRTARGAGRLDLVRDELGRFLAADDLLRFRLPDDRVWELREDEVRPRLLRDAGGEDVRVAMLRA